MLALLLGCAPGVADVDLSVTPTWTDDIAPLYAERCVDCHRSDGVMAAGVPLDSFAAARSTRVRSACVSIEPPLVELFADVLLPGAGRGSPVPCDGWTPFSMPPGAMQHLTLHEQVLLARWVELGAPQ